MSYYIRSGGRITVSDSRDITVTEKLETGTYVVNYDEIKNLIFLVQVNDMTPPPVVYGNAKKIAERVVAAFNRRTGSTGVLLSGEKGSGKTMLAKMLSQWARGKDMATLLVQTPIPGNLLGKFLQDIDHPCVVLLDEFEKMFNNERDEQSDMLSIFDGVFPSKKLFVVTCNSLNNINDNLINRPGRLFYHIAYSGASESTIRDYCKRNLKNQEHLEDILKISVIIDPFNFDLMTAIVEECNGMNESPFESIKYVNAKPDFYGKNYNVVVTCSDGESYTHRGHLWLDDPINMEPTEFFFIPKKKKKREVTANLHRDDTPTIDFDVIKVIISGKHLVGINYKMKSFVYEVKENDTGRIFTVEVFPTSYSYNPNRFSDL